jgi:hypothetical protein
VFFHAASEIRVKDFAGEWKLSEQQALKLAREKVRALGYTEEQMSIQDKPEVTRPFLVGPKIIPRYMFRWQTVRPNHTGSAVRVEVDAQRGRVTEIWLGCRPALPKVAPPQPHASPRN